MDSKVVLHAASLEGFLTDEDKKDIDSISELYSTSLDICSRLEKNSADKIAQDELISISKQIGAGLEEIVSNNPRIHTYCFETPSEQHAQASRIIAKLRNEKTEHEEFLYYIQRAYELLFPLAFVSKDTKKRSLIQKTPVEIPVRNYAVHRIPDIDEIAHNSVMCVMLRGALLPSMIISKELEDYSSDGFITPFALFRIKRDESRSEHNMDYVLDLDKSFFDFNALDGKDLIFADPMNATGGSLVTIVNYLKENGVRPKSIKVINVISALKGALRITRAIEEAEIYTLWMDPVLNDSAYILPGLGDAGDRLNGVDTPDRQRNMIQLIADYGQSIVNLYRDQVFEIEKTVFI